MADDVATCIDAHCHLVDPQFLHDINDVVDRAEKVGVAAALCVAIVPSDFEKIISLSERFPQFVVPCLGVHPVQDEDNLTSRSVTNEDLAQAIPLIEKYSDRIAAIGEVGLDFTPRFCKSDEEKKTQRNVLIKQVELAKKYNLPLNVHSRSAGRPTIALLREQGAKSVLLHAFDGRPAVAMEGVKEGYYFSIPPSIVRSEQGRNEPSNIRISAEYIAKIKGVDVSKVMTLTTENALKLFPMLKTLLRFK